MFPSRIAMKNLTDFLRRQIDLIASDRGLRLFGVVIAATHLVTVIHWAGLGYTKSPICFPLIPCETISGLLLHDYKWAYLSVYGLVSLIAGLAFLFKKTSAAYAGLILATLLKVIFHLADYRNMGNYHYMAHVIGLVYLFADNKKSLLRLAIVLFYFSAGALKFNTDWLSGAAIGRPFFFGGKLLEWAMAYVIVLELLLSWLLFSRRRLLRWITLAQLYTFHILSYWVVGYFYPVLMGLFLLLFFLTEEEDTFPPRLNPFEWSAVALFAFLQFVPMVFFPNSGLDGSGRIISLNMFDVRSVCETNMFLKHKDHVIEYNPIFNLGIRIHCDPNVILSHVKKTCEDQKNSATFVDIDLNHQVRMFTQKHVPVSLTFKDVCSRPLKMSLLGQLKQEDS